ncbi:MAG: AmmeMemoRadiSam system protein B [Bacteroidales bacterium]|nr:AmmeMemoRadiSam system protein B [Bacteroidales bacterium]MCF8402589.1 AmmeMemoRadiSam system protein B [Bacteroidales bacterium]
MNYKIFNGISILLLWITISACHQKERVETNVRSLADTVGFAQYDWQMDSIIARIRRMENQNSEMGKIHFVGNPKVVICPHDDYAYVGNLYPSALQNIKAKTVILFGVAHKAKLLNLEDQIVFDSYNFWKGPYGNIKVSELRDAIIERLPSQIFQVNDSMQRMEHSVEAILPFLQYFNSNVEIVSILVPYMSFDKMEEIAKPLSTTLQKYMEEKDLIWGKDLAIVISTDAVHYGDEDWGGKDFAKFGTDSIGYVKALKYEQRIIDILSGYLTPQKIQAFCNFTVNENDFREYNWTWCGRYSVPLGLLTSYHLNEALGNEPLKGSKIGYANSIDHPVVEVNDLGMGTTAPAHMRHWVGYAAIGYK